jgi:hypothetical protein
MDGCKCKDKKKKRNNHVKIKYKKIGQRERDKRNIRWSPN